MTKRIVLWVLCCATLNGSAVIVDHTYVDAVRTYSPALLDAIGTQRWFFSHASVGGNMISGIHALHSENTTRYQWITASVSYNSSGQRSADPPTPTLAGCVYDCGRGNPGWQNKCTIFSNSVTVSGWHAPAVDAAMDKLCYIDQTANPSNYIALMTALEAAYPATRFVYITMPLTTATDANNALRNAYNRHVRQHCATYGKLLFDLADIEAHDTNGVEQSFVYSGLTNQRLWSAYTSDGGHLNALGQERAALGWYAAGAQIALPEPAGCVMLLALVMFHKHARRRRLQHALAAP